MDLESFQQLLDADLARFRQQLAALEREIMEWGNAMAAAGRGKEAAVMIFAACVLLAPLAIVGAVLS